MLHQAVHQLYLKPQKPTAARLAREVAERCGVEKVRPPSPSTVRRRLKALSIADMRLRGEEHPEAKPVQGHAPHGRYPLDLVQVDHTPMDLIVVDPIDREPIGRPWLTVAIDTYSRCIAGFHITLEAPSATSVALCLTHLAMDKAPWLAMREVDVSWPAQGKPRRLGVDNGSDFHSQAFERGCAQHGIAIEWRPPGRPHFGGVIERVIGTLMGLVHGLPGTTFSNVGQRGSYDSDKAACLTLEEVEHWIAIAVTKYYHQNPHGGLDGQTPMARWRDGVLMLQAKGDNIQMPRDSRAFLVDFLPVLRRSLQRDGITIDHLTYFSSALRAWITARDRPGPLLIRRDPRDLSRVFVLDPQNDSYLEVPTRDLSRPSISLWEHRLARRRLRLRHLGEVDEAALFGAIEEMRATERAAKCLTRSARRDRARRAMAPGQPAEPPPTSLASTAPVAAEIVVPDVVEVVAPSPFEIIEQW